MTIWETLRKISSEEEAQIGKYFELYEEIDQFYNMAIERGVNNHKEIELNECVGGKDIKYLLSKVGTHFQLNIQCEPGLLEMSFLGPVDVDKIQYSISRNFDQASIYAHNVTDKSATVTPKADPESFWKEIVSLNVGGIDRLRKLAKI